MIKRGERDEQLGEPALHNLKFGHLRIVPEERSGRTRTPTLIYVEDKIGFCVRNSGSEAWGCDAESDGEPKNAVGRLGVDRIIATHN